jgi:hypothetical protein
MSNGRRAVGVAGSEHDESRKMTADYLDAQVAGTTDARALRAAAAGALSLYGGNGSFSDVGTAESARGRGPALGAASWSVLVLEELVTKRHFMSQFVSQARLSPWKLSLSA